MKSQYHEGRGELPDGTMAHEVTLVFWVPEAYDPREFIAAAKEYAENLGAELVSEDWSEV